MVIEIIANPIYEDLEIVAAENVQVLPIPIPNTGIVKSLSIITGLLIFIAGLGLFMFFLLV